MLTGLIFFLLHVLLVHIVLFLKIMKRDYYSFKIYSLIFFLIYCAPILFFKSYPPAFDWIIYSTPIGLTITLPPIILYSIFGESKYFRYITIPSLIISIFSSGAFIAQA